MNLKISRNKTYEVTIGVKTQKTYLAKPYLEGTNQLQMEILYGECFQTCFCTFNLQTLKLLLEKNFKAKFIKGKNNILVFVKTKTTRKRNVEKYTTIHKNRLGEIISTPHTKITYSDTTLVEETIYVQIDSVD